MTVGDPCPAGDWPVGLPADGDIVYVKSGGTGDGSSPESAVGTLAAALRRANWGAVVAIAKGDYAETVATTRLVTFWGACAAAVRIGGPAGPLESATVEVRSGGDVTLKNVTVRGARIGVAALLRATLRASGVEVSSAVGIGVLIFGEGDLRNVVVRNTSALADGTFGTGIQVADGAKLTGTGISLESNRQAGIAVFGPGSAATIDEVLVRSTESEPTGRNLGSGLAVEAGAHATITGGVFDGNRAAGISVRGRRSVATLADVVVARTRPQEVDEALGVGLRAFDGARVTGTRLLVDENRAVGVDVRDAGTAVELTELAVRHTGSEASSRMFGTGLQASAGSHVAVARALFEANRTVGVTASGSGTSVSLADVFVHRTRNQELDDRFGFGIGVGGARLSAERTVIDANLAAGIYAHDPGTELALAHVVVSNTEAEVASRRDGIGLGIADGAHGTVSSSEFLRNRNAAVYIDGNATIASLRDVVMSETRSEARTKYYGVGLSVGSGAHVSAVGATIDRNRSEGVQAAHAGTELVIEDSSISNTAPTDSDGGSGIGLGVTAGAKAVIRSSRITGNRVAGVLAMGAAFLEMSATEVTATAGGKVTLPGPDGTTLDGPSFEGVGDGVVVAQGSTGTIRDVRTTRNARAGVLFSGSSGSVEGVISTQNRFGLALQGTPTPTYAAASCQLDGNAEHALLTDGNLPVANAPPQIPEPPPPPAR